MSFSRSDLRNIIGDILLASIPAEGAGLVNIQRGLEQLNGTLCDRAIEAANSPDGPRIPADATDEELLAWLLAKAASYGVSGLTLTIYTYKYTAEGAPTLQVLANHPNASYFGSGNTVDDAVASVVKRIETPATKATRLRAEADKLMAQVTALETS